MLLLLSISLPPCGWLVDERSDDGPSLVSMNWIRTPCTSSVQSVTQYFGQLHHFFLNTSG
jgi:hypothetical protein